MRPQDLFLPQKFTEFRPGQEKALEIIAATKKRFTAVQAPPGVGKSLLGAAAQRMLNLKMLYVCQTIQLQEQILADFPYARLLKGRVNYSTANYPGDFPQVNCSQCTKTRKRYTRQNGQLIEIDPPEKTCRLCPSTKVCPYEIAKREALASDFTVMNYAYWLAEANSVGRFGEKKDQDGNSVRMPLVVLDEADTLEKSLMGFIELRVPTRLAARLRIQEPSVLTVQDNRWVEWAQGKDGNGGVKKILEDRLLSLSERWGIEGGKEQDEIERLLTRLEFFVSDIQSGNSWVYAERENIVFRPVKVSSYGQNTVWRHGERFILMSGTLISAREVSKDLGVPYSEIEFIDLPSEFEPSRYPVFYSPSVSMSNKSKDVSLPMMAESVDKSLDKYTRHKVLVHTVSKGLATYIYENSRHKSRMIVYGGDGLRREDALRNYIEASYPAVLVAQSMDRGVNLPDELCRVILVTKIPYGDLSDKQVSARVYGTGRDGQTWYVVNAWRSLIQMTGRGMRHENDWVITEILDANFGERLWPQHKYLAPKWWKERLRLPKEYREPRVSRFNKG